MVGPSHAVVALASVVGIGRLLDVTPNAWGLIAILFGSLSPDIDGGEASISRPTRLLGGFIPRGIGNIVDSIVRALSHLIKVVVGHRGFFHWPILGGAIIAGGVWFRIPWLAWFGVGYLSHILADFLTHEGVPILGPLSFKKHGLELFRTGSVLEAVIVAVLALVTIYFGFGLLPLELQQGFIDLRQYLRRHHGGQ